MRLNLSQRHLLGNQSLLSQSLSDLRLEDNKLTVSPGRNNLIKASTPLRKRSAGASNNTLDEDIGNNNCDDDSLLVDESIISRSPSNTNSAAEKLSRLASPADSITTMTPTSSSHDSNEEIGKLADAINEQKDVIIKCLESETCDVDTLNEQLAVFQTMQEKYTKLEFEQARNLWMAGVRHLNDEEAGDGDYETQFSMLVEQEVERRLFQEKILKSDGEYQEKELERLEREREIASLKRQHEREIYMLKRKLAENASNGGQSRSSASTSEVNSSLDSEAAVSRLGAVIPNYSLSGVGSSSHVEYQVHIRACDAQWVVMRRFRQFRDLHVAMTNAYGSIVTALPFPSRRLFGNKSASVSHERQAQLSAYLNFLLLTLSKVETSPIYMTPTKAALMELSSFFHEDAQEATEAIGT